MEGEEKLECWSCEGPVGEDFSEFYDEGIFEYSCSLQCIIFNSVVTDKVKWLILEDIIDRLRESIVDDFVNTIDLNLKVKSMREKLETIFYIQMLKEKLDKGKDEL